MSGFSAEDMAALREQGDLSAMFSTLLGKAPTAEDEPEDDEPSYHIARLGAWPCGTQPAGPPPGPKCGDCAA